MRPLVYLLGANAAQRAALSLAASNEVRLEPVASIAELTPQAVLGVDVFLVWDEGNAIPQLRAHLAILAHRAPIIAIAERPTIPQVVGALTAGSVDYLEYPCSGEALRRAVMSAVETSARILPLKHRAIEARRQLSCLSRRERQVLTAMAQGMSTKTIAAILEIDPRTVEIDRRNLLDKLELEHSAEAIRIELEASLNPDWSRQADWMAPWLLEASLTGSH